jgi:hypothetical protein
VLADEQDTTSVLSASPFAPSTTRTALRRARRSRAFRSGFA